MLGYSVYGDCLDGTDQGVRLDCYDWEEERCYYEGKLELATMYGEMRVKE